MLNSSYWINYKVAKYFNLKTKHNYYFWLHWVFVAAWATSQRGQRGLLSSCGTGCSQCWPLLMRSAGSSAQAPVAVAPTLSSTGSIMWCVGLVAQQNVGFSQIRDQTRVPCTGRWILNHWTTREVSLEDFRICLLSLVLGNVIINVTWNVFTIALYSRFLHDSI